MPNLMQMMERKLEKLESIVYDHPSPKEIMELAIPELDRNFKELYQRYEPEVIIELEKKYLAILSDYYQNVQ